MDDRSASIALDIKPDFCAQISVTERGSSSQPSHDQPPQPTTYSVSFGSDLHFSKGSSILVRRRLMIRSACDGASGSRFQLFFWEAVVGFSAEERGSENAGGYVPLPLCHAP